MVDNGAVVMPADIVAAIADSTTAQGWLSGARLKSERVYVITSATLGEQKKVCEYFEQLITHRSWAISQGEPKELLLEWRRIEFDLFDRFPAYKWFNTA